jgi:hypothetical protein
MDKDMREMLNHVKGLKVSEVRDRRFDKQAVSTLTRQKSNLEKKINSNPTPTADKEKYKINLRDVKDNLRQAQEKLDKRAAAIRKLDKDIQDLKRS